MMSIVYVFWMYVILFAIIGAVRGNFREIIVLFSVVLSIAINYVLRKYIPFVNALENNSITLFWIRTSILLALVFFGYQTVSFVRGLEKKAVKERFQDVALGFVFGAINGWFVVGSFWHFLHSADYPFTNIVTKPEAGSALEATVIWLIQRMPPDWLVEPWIYFAVFIAFILVLVFYV